MGLVETVNEACIYALLEADGYDIRYMGKTIKSISDRLSRHLSTARRGIKSRVYNWIRAVELKVRIVTLEKCLIADVDRLEKKWIAYYRSSGANLLNVSDGGNQCGGFSLTPEQRNKIRESNFRRFSDPAARERVSESNRTRQKTNKKPNHTLAGREAMRAANKRPKTEKEKESMRAAGLRRMQDPAQKAALLARRPCGPLPLEQKQKLSAATKGVSKSEETRRKMTAAWIKRKAEQKIYSTRIVLLSHEGVTLARSQWAARLGVSNSTLQSRQRNGWSVKEILYGRQNGD